MTDYVTGFMFSYDLKKVAMIQKNRPDWQAGKLNGIGGKIESIDSNPLKAMIREFKEETGVEAFNWKCFARTSLEHKDYVDFFCTTGGLRQLKTMTDEIVTVINVADISDFVVIENILWLIPLALDFMDDGRPEFVEITYTKRRMPHERS